MSDDALHVDMPNEASWPLESVDSLCSLISRGTAPVYVEHSDVLAIGQRCVATTGFVADLARPHSHQTMRNVLRPEAGDVLLNSTGTGTIGRSVVFDAHEAFIVDGHVTVLRPRMEVADCRWLNSVLRTPWFQRHLERFCYSGSTNQLELSRTPLRESRLPTPHIEEQQRIAQILDTLDTAIHETEAIIAKLKAVKQGLLHDLLTHGIDANGELRPPQTEAPHLYKESPLGWIPRGWSVIRLDEYCLSVADGTHDSPKPSDSGYPLVTSKNLRDGRLDLTDSYLISEADYRAVRVRSAIMPGDLLFGMIGTVGNPVVIEAGQDQIATKNVGLLRIGGDFCRGRFLRDWLESASIERQLGEVMSGSTQRFIGLSTLRSLFTLEPDANEMVHIVSASHLISLRIDTEHASLKDLEALKNGLMDDLLTGRVRVTPLLDNPKP